MDLVDTVPVPPRDIDSASSVSCAGRARYCQLMHPGGDGPCACLVKLSACACVSSRGSICRRNRSALRSELKVVASMSGSGSVDGVCRGDPHRQHCHFDAWISVPSLVWEGGPCRHQMGCSPACGRARCSPLLLLRLFHFSLHSVQTEKLVSWLSFVSQARHTEL